MCFLIYHSMKHIIFYSYLKQSEKDHLKKKKKNQDNFFFSYLWKRMYIYFFRCHKMILSFR